MAVAGRPGPKAPLPGRAAKTRNDHPHKYNSARLMHRLGRCSPAEVEVDQPQKPEHRSAIALALEPDSVRRWPGSSWQPARHYEWAVGERTGLPRTPHRAGIVAHTGSNGLVGVPCEYGPPWHTATEGICAHLGSSGPVGKSEPGSPGLGSSSGAGVPDVPTKPGIAFAGTVAPVAGIAISATATAIFVIVLRAPEAIAQFIHRSLARTQTGDTAD